MHLPYKLTDECFTVLVQHLFVFALSGLTHQGVGDWPRQSRGMAAVVLETLGDVLCPDRCTGLEFTHIQNELMSIETLKESIHL